MSSHACQFVFLQTHLSSALSLAIPWITKIPSFSFSKLWAVGFLLKQNSIEEFNILQYDGFGHIHFLPEEITD